MKEYVPGTQVGGRFRIIRRIARGGMGTVYEAVDATTERPIALKVMHEEFLSDQSAVERFRREGDVIRTIQHPAVVGLEDVGTLPDGSLYLALELLRGENLEERLARYGAMIPELTVPLMRGICEGVGAAHAAGIVHRDLKPANIFLPDWSEVERSLRTGTTPLVKIVDFGVALVGGLSRLTQQGYAVGTTRSMAPEQLRGQEVGAQADIYAIALVAFEMLTSEHPFYRQRDNLLPAILQGRYTPLRAIRLALAVEIQEVLDRAMSIRASDRHPSTQELLVAYVAAVQTRSKKTPDLSGFRAEPTGPLVPPDSTTIDRISRSEPRPALPNPKPAVRTSPAEPRLIPTTRPPPGRGGAANAIRAPVTAPKRSWLLIGIGLALVFTLLVTAAGLIAWQAIT